MGGTIITEDDLRKARERGVSQAAEVDAEIEERYL
jgi:hypothetical protein